MISGFRFGFSAPDYPIKHVKNVNFAALGYFHRGSIKFLQIDFGALLDIYEFKFGFSASNYPIKRIKNVHCADLSIFHRTTQEVPPDRLWSSESKMCKTRTGELGEANLLQLSAWF